MGETRARRRIRKAVEARGYKVLDVTWQPWGACFEKSGIDGGWTVLTDAPYWPNTNYGNEFMGLSVEEVLADIDWMMRPTEACDCPDSDTPSPRHGSRYQGMPEAPIHLADCRWHIAYRMPWWKS